MLPRPSLAAEGDRLRALLCAGCGALLPSTDPLEMMLGKLAQLARFGLDPEGRPLLKPARHES